MNILTMFFNFLFFGLPLAAVIWFVWSLVCYLSTRKKEKDQPGSVSTFEMKSRKINLIASSVVAGILIAVVLGIFILLAMAIAYM